MRIITKKILLLIVTVLFASTFFYGCMYFDSTDMFEADDTALMTEPDDGKIKLRVVTDIENASGCFMAAAR